MAVLQGFTVLVFIDFTGIEKILIDVVVMLKIVDHAKIGIAQEVTTFLYQVSAIQQGPTWIVRWNYT